MSIRRRFILAFALFSIALATGFGWIAWTISRSSLEDQLDQTLISVAGAAVESGIQSAIVLSLDPGFENERGFLVERERLRRLLRYVDGAWIFRASERTSLVSHAGDSIPIGTPLRFLEPYQAEIAEALEEGYATSTTFEGEGGRLYKYGFRQIGDPGQAGDSEAMLAVLIPADFLEPLERLRNLLLLGTLLGVGLAVWLGAGLAAGIARPLERLSRAALRIQRGRLDRPVHLDRQDELGRLADAMERMRIGIVTRDEQLRLMLAQVAHEIRNPLGGLELFASAASDTENPEERARIMGRIRNEVTSLNRIIEEFLTFARPTTVELERVDIRHPIEAAAFLAGDESDRLQVRLPESPILVRADPDQIKRLVLNLIRNALQVADQVRVSVGELNGETVITVSDDGPGVPADRRERIFEPFVTDKEQGAGLGLAIVKRVAEAHGGRVRVDPDPDPAFGKGACFRVYLPGMEDMPSTDVDPDVDG